MSGLLEPTVPWQRRMLDRHVKRTEVRLVRSGPADSGVVVYRIPQSPPTGNNDRGAPAWAFSVDTATLPAGE